MRTLFKDILLTLVGVLLGFGTAWWEVAGGLDDRLRPAVVEASLALLVFGAVFTLVSHRRGLLSITAVISTVVPLLLSSFVETRGILLLAPVAHVSALAVGATIGYCFRRYVTRNAA